MSLMLLAAVMLAALLAPACASSDDGPPAAGQEATRQLEPAPLEEIRFEMALGQPFRVDASQLPPLLGEPALEGKVVLKFLSVQSELVVRKETIPIVATGYGGDAS